MRYLPLQSADRAAMLARIGVASVDALYADVPAAAICPPQEFDLPSHSGEIEVERDLKRLASHSVTDAACFCGAGAYRHHVPASVDHLIQRSEFLTSYTPYQPEISQGTLQYLFEFQTQVALLTGMEVANASMYDGSTAAAEAVLMALRITRKNTVLVAGNLHPHYAQTIDTLAGLHATIHHSVVEPGAADVSLDGLDDSIAAVVVQNPDVFGTVRDLTPIAEAVHAKGALLIVVVTEAVSLGLIESPGAMGADIVVGEGQSIGNGLNFGGPYVGLFATREKYVRQMPGRLCGETVDADGRRGYVLTLSTREQHIRREKATSNICTNSGLCALAFSIHLTLLGEVGLTRLSALNHARAGMLADALTKISGVELVTEAFFNEFTIRLPKAAAPVTESLVAKGLLAGVPASRLFPRAGMENYLIVAATETISEEDISAFATHLQEVL
ncbi:MAG: aminomethyl-transferring glycine dehydrogenase subunit GcvPA [Rhizomicrobium sp.]